MEKKEKPELTIEILAEILYDLYIDTIDKLWVSDIKIEMDNDYRTKDWETVGPETKEIFINQANNLLYQISEYGFFDGTKFRSKIEIEENRLNKIIED